MSDNTLSWKNLNFGSQDAQQCGICHTPGVWEFAWEDGVLKEDTLCITCEKKYVYDDTTDTYSPVHLPYTTKQIDEQKAFDSGLYVWISIVLDKCPHHAMLMVTHSVPNFLEYYAKQMGFIDYKDATDFFKEIKDTYNKLGKVPLLELLKRKESDMIMEILKG